MRIVEAAYRRGGALLESVNGPNGTTLFEECQRAQFIDGDVLIILREDDYKALVADAEVTRTARKYRPENIRVVEPEKAVG